MSSTTPISYALVGFGWRAPFFLKPATWFPERFRVTGVVTRTAERGEEVAQQWSLPSWRTVGEAVEADRPDFIVASVPWPVSPDIVREAVGLDVPVLCETPPAPNLEELHRLWSDVGGSGLVQVAEQYPFYPGHQARRALIDAGLIGDVHETEVSSTHMYHATAIIRQMLGTGMEGARVTAIANTHPLADPLGVPGWSDDDTPKDAKTVRGLFEFDSGKVATYDFTDNQWWNPLRADRIAVRGTRGEIVDDRVTSLQGLRTIVTSHLERRHTGVELNLEGNDLDHISHGADVVYDNQWTPGRLADDEIAVTELLSRMGAWVRDGGDQPYSLAEGAQDWALALAVEEAASTGAAVRVDAQPWSDQA